MRHRRSAYRTRASEESCRLVLTRGGGRSAAHGVAAAERSKSPSPPASQTRACPSRRAALGGRGLVRVEPRVSDAGPRDITLHFMRDDTDAKLVAEIWSSIRSAAAAKAANTPLLARSFHERVLRQPDLATCIGRLLAHELADECVCADELLELMAAVTQRHGQIVLAAAHDLTAFVTRDPASEDHLAALLNQKGFRALQLHRIAHELWREGDRAIARYLHGRMAMVFAIDIHPAARIGRGILIDHGTGIVIGETAVVEDDVSMLHGVTLGGTGKTLGDRHPKVREGVMIGAGATVLGNVEIGVGSKIAAGSVVLKSVPAHTTVAGVPAQIVGRPAEARPALDMVQDIQEDG
jgi:serine O-acetyltransferase